MKDMSEMGGGTNFYGEMPDTFNMVVNTSHPLVEKIKEGKEKSTGKKLEELQEKSSPLAAEKDKIEAAQKDKKEEEVPQADKDKLEDLGKQIDELKKKEDKVLSSYGTKDKIVKQLIDLALLSNNMLKGEDLIKFVDRSVELIK